MILKKINAVLGLAIIASLLAHAGTMTFSLITFWYDLGICKGFARLTIALVVVHALLSAGMFFFCHDGAGLRHGRLNARTIVQRVSALAMVVLVHLHVTAYANMATGETLSPEQAVFTCITEIAFVASAFSHVAVSFGKALVTMGWISSLAAAKRVDRILAVVCTVLAAVAIFAIARFFIGGLL